jgi:hypothetical protein
MKPKVLWIEDGAFTELQNMSSPIYVSGKYNLVIALDATEGLQHLRQAEKPYEAIIVDIRLPPGKDPEFQKLFSDRGSSRTTSRLGLALLKYVLKDGEKHGIPAHHRQPERFGVFTVEGRDEMQEDLQQLGIKIYHQKIELHDKYKLSNIIEEIRAQHMSRKR